MATIGQGTSHLEKLGWYLGHCNHQQWDRFSTDSQQRMVEEDLSAGTSVSLVLGSLITIGMLLSAITLAVVWWQS